MNASATPGQISTLRDHGITPEIATTMLRERVTAMEALTKDQASTLIQMLRARAAKGFRQPWSLRKLSDYDMGLSPMSNTFAPVRVSRRAR